jgi:hypothetical protein
MARNPISPTSKTDTIALSMGVLRSGESLGSAFAYAVGSVKSASLLTNLIVATVVFYAAVPATTWAAWLVQDHLPGENEQERSDVEPLEDTEELVSQFDLRPNVKK